MAATIPELMQKHHAYYEVQPYYVVIPQHASGSTRTVQAGFDIEVCGIRTSHGPGPSADYRIAYEALQKLAKMVMDHSTDRCIVEVIPSPSTVFLDTARHLEQYAMLRIRITHARGLEQSAGAPEERALKEIQQQLRNLGIGQGRSRT